jgi:formylglycine-generating enzyme required for sulfatase activity
VGVSPEGEPLVEMSPESWEYAWLLLAESQPTPEGLGLRPVGSYPDGASPYGALDLIGNAAEYVADWYNPGGYWDLPDENPQTLGPPWNHVVRGGSWFSYFPSAEWVSERSRCAARNWSHSADEPRAGLRCVFPVP